MISSEIYQAIEQVIYRYSFAMDTRRWEEMDRVFLDDARIYLEDQLYPSRAAGVDAIRGFIECCSQTHHMNCNIMIESATAETVRTVSGFRAWHRGRGARAEEVLECMGTYVDEFRHTAAGWRIAERREASPIAIGDIAAFFSDLVPPA